VIKNSIEDAVPGAKFILVTRKDVSGPFVITHAQMGNAHKPTMAIAPGIVLKPFETVIAASQFKPRFRSCQLPLLPELLASPPLFA